MTDSPGVGDILCYDENRKYKFIQCDTFHAGTFPAAWETVGVVVLRKGNTVTVCSKHNESKKFMEVFPYIVTGQVLDGAEHTATLKLHGSEVFDFKYTASTDEEFVEALKSFLTEHNFTDWSAYLMDGNVYLQYDNYTSSEYLLASITQATGITLNTKCAIDMPIVPRARRKCGNDGNYIWNVAKAKQYFKSDSNNTAFNPEEDVTFVPTYPICWPAFAGTSQYQSDHCLWLRQQYCKDPTYPKVEEWEAYLDDLAPVSPAMIGSFAPEWRGREEFDKIKDVTYMATDGTQKPLYPGANYCSKFFDGKGYLPSPYEFYEMFKDLTLGLRGVTNQTADAVNRSLYAMGGNTISTNSSYWICARGYDNGVHFANNISYCDYYSPFFGNRKCIPVLRLDLTTASEQ